MARRLDSELLTALSTPSTDGFYSIIREDDLEWFTNYAPGVLEGFTCSEDVYLLIPRELGVYDLVDGILRFHGMGNHRHNTIQHVLLNKFRAEVRKGLAEYSGRMEATVRLASRTIRIPDLVIGPSTAKDADEKFFFDLVDKPSLLPDIVVEVTSSNRVRDFQTKKQNYESLRIPNYWIVDTKKQVIVVHKLTRGRYRNKTYKIGENFVSKYFGRVNVTHVFMPQSPTEEEYEIGIREREERKRLQATARKAKERAEKLAEENRQLKAALRARSKDRINTRTGESQDANRGRKRSRRTSSLSPLQLRCRVVDRQNN